MDYLELQEYIYSHIPIVKDMEFELGEIVNDNITVIGKFNKHINHRNSVFGGSINSIMTLAGWAKVKIMMDKISEGAVIVIKSCTTDFIKPVLDDFEAVTESTTDEEYAKFLRIYERKGRARIDIRVNLYEKGKKERLATFIGEFVVVRK
jgi:thioesterase domain-containing protein